MVIHEFSGRELFSIRARPPIPGGLPIADLDFSAGPVRLGGAGIYVISMPSSDCMPSLETAIYIGSYRGERHSLHGGNIVQTRWVPHVSSLTGRGRRISLSKRGITRVRTEFGGTLGAGFAAIADAVCAADVDVLRRDRGCQTTPSRLRIAATHYDAFSGLGVGAVGALDLFKFAYIQLEPADVQGHDPRVIGQLVRAAESELVARFNPNANATAKPRGEPVGAAIVVQAVHEALSRRLGGTAAAVVS